MKNTKYSIDETGDNNMRYHNITRDDMLTETAFG